jgi:glycine betaine/proline transport system substrate-binding protein
MSAGSGSLKAKLKCCTALLAIALTPAFDKAATTDESGRGVSIIPISPTISEARFWGEIAMAGLKDLGFTIPITAAKVDPENPMSDAVCRQILYVC